MTKRDRMMLIGVLAVVLLGGFWFLVITPQRKAAADVQSRLTAAQNDLSSAQSKLSAGKAARDAFQRDRTTVIKLGRVVPQSDDVPTLLLQLEALAKRENVKFTKYAINNSGGAGADSATATTPNVQEGTASTDAVAPLYSPGSVETTGGLARTPITITLVGKYFDLEQYLRAVQRFAVLSAKRTTTNGRLIIVDGFAYTPGALATGQTDDQAKKRKKGDSPTLTATLAASVYYAPPLQTPKASGTAAGSPSAPADAASSTSTGTATVGALR